MLHQSISPLGVASREVSAPGTFPFLKVVDGALRGLKSALLDRGNG